MVSTTIGCEGIDVEPDRQLLVADTPAEFAHATLRLLEDKQFAAELGRNGRQLIQAKYDYRTACRPIDAAYQRSREPMVVP
jgi:glycosyltransferase involved in cell wall biosynthesis